MATNTNLTRNTGLYHGTMNAPDPDARQQGLESAAEAGDSDAMVKLGILNAQRGERDGAWRWWERAEQAGNSDAWLYLGIVCAEWLEQPDVQMARFYWQRAALKGSSEAARKLKELG